MENLEIRAALFDSTESGRIEISKDDGIELLEVGNQKYLVSFPRQFQESVGSRMNFRIILGSIFETAQKNNMVIPEVKLSYRY